MIPRFRGTFALLVVAAATLVAGCERPPPESVQRGFRGTGIGQRIGDRAVA
mgnify:CR=1 FL=1